MIPLTFLTGAKTYLTLGVIAALAAAAGVQTLRLDGAKTDMAEHLVLDAQVETDRTRVALTDALRTSEKVAAFKAREQGLTDDLTNETAARIAAERNNGAIAQQLRDTFAAFAASDRSAAKAGPGTAGPAGDRSLSVDRLFGEAGELLARSADLSEEARSVVQRRDSEVKALKAENAALRILLNDEAE